MFGLPEVVIIGFFAAVIAVCAWIIYLIKQGKKADAADVYKKARYLAGEVVAYVEQISKTQEMTNEQKKLLAVEKLGTMLKEFYGWDVSPIIIDMAIEVALKLYNITRDMIANNKK